MAKNGEEFPYWTLPEFLVHGEDGGDGVLSPELIHGFQKNGEGPFAAQFGDHEFFSSELTPELVHSFKRNGATGRFGSPFGDDDCFTAALTREFAHSSSSSVRRSAYGFEDEKPWGSYGSPESSLSSPSGGGCNGCFSCSAPSLRRVTRSDAALGLLQAAVEEIARLRMVEEAALFQRTMEKPAPVSVHRRVPRQSPLHQPYQQDMNAFQFQMLRQQLEVTQKKSHYRQAQRGAVHGGGRRQTGSPASGSGGRPVFQGIPAPKKRECAGTGVFLPRGVGVGSPPPPPPPRKKHGSSTVPEDRHAPAAAQPKYNGWSNSKEPDHGEVVPPRFRSGTGGGGMVDERRRISRQHSVDELHLPQEWTY